MRTANSLSRAWLVILTLILGATSVFAEAPRPAVEFNAAVGGEPNGGAKYVKLSWFMAQDGDLATGFDIFMAKGETEDPAAFEKIATVPARDKEPRGQYMYKVEHLDDGTYTFFVVSYNNDGRADRTRIRVVTLKREAGGDAWVKFMTEPKRAGVETEAYRYEAKAKASVDGAITYELTHGPDGMTIDAATGLITWEHPKAGRYEIRIVASLTTAAGVLLKGVQEYVLEIKGEEPPKPEACVTISGKVTLDGTDDLVMNGVVIAWRTNSDDPATGKFEPVIKAELRQGFYSIKVPAGTYKLRVEGGSFIAEWYENAHEIADAKTFEAVCDTPEMEINFSVEGRPVTKMFVLEGRVTDAVTGEGLRGVVKFDARSKDGANLDHNLLHRVAETREDGNYRVELPEGIAFIAFAQSFAPANTISPYVGEYWEETGDVTEATLITLTESTGGVNFTLERRAEYDNSISGRLVNNETDDAVKGKVTAYLVKSRDHKELDRRWSVTVETDAEGHYTFTNLIPGNYVVLGTPAERPLVPGFYVKDGPAEIKWQHATQVEVGEDSKHDGYAIRLHAIKGEHGRGRIHGWVFNKRGGIVAPTNNTKGDADVQDLELNGIIGALVVATVNGEIVDYAFSENGGSYELAAMGTGTATLNINRFNFDNVTFDVTVDDARADQQFSFGLDAEVTGVEVPVDRVGKDVGLYPNPANTSATVSFTATTGTAVIKVVDMTGVVLFTNVMDVNAGPVAAQLNLTSLPAGMVMVHVSNGTSTFALPLSIHR